MMKPMRTMIIAAAGVSMLALAGCGGGDKAPEGQVVATVDGKDVTIHELNAEIAGLGAQAQSAPKKLVEAVALNRVIERKMLSAEAKVRELDKSPQFLLAKTRTEEGLLVQALQGDIQGKVQATAREAAQKYVADNPVVFGDRKLFTLDQIQFLRPSNFEQLPLKDAKTMAEVERVLIDANIEYRRAPQQVDTMLIAPELSKEIIKLTSSPNAEPFMFADQPAGAPAPVVYVNMLTSTKTQPFTGEKAISYAQQILQRQEVSKRLQTELKKIQTSFKAKTVYAKGYGTVEAAQAELKKGSPAAAALAAPPAAQPAKTPATTPVAPAAK
ncbi:hypothetical protein [Sandarakinorhabdus sp.]|uniref:hypothetical protein n=1 Tax=Sandarakinorhabdus sp. TaxID=1916663 RepID=UPI00286DDB5C|nr:hypothetical protein [Sandarakinorhabdus sp.]